MTDDDLPPILTDEPPPSSPAPQRGVSPVAGRFGLGRTGQAAAVTALAAGCGLFLLATARHPPPKPAAAQTPAKQVVAFEPADAASGPPTLADPGPDAPTLGPATAAAPTATEAGVARAKDAPATQAARPAPILAFSRKAEAGADPLVPAIAVAQAALPESELDQLRRAGPIGLSRATRLPDRSFLILAGASIPCVLQTAMDTSTPGYVSCIIPSDVYSENGAVVLLERGAKVLGEYRGGLKRGQGRLFVLWTRAVTPGGVAISLASPASDALGRAGFDGDLDGHFWQRFGGAILLSVIDGGLGALGRSGDGINVQAPSAAADTALKGAIDIPPTLHKAPGEQIAIFAAQDFDFSGVYGVAGR